MEAKAHLKYLRISPRKVSILCDIIRGKDAKTACVYLMQTPKAALQRRAPVYKVSRLNDEAHVLFNKEFPRRLIALLSQYAEPLIGHVGRIHRLPPSRSWRGTTS